MAEETIFSKIIRREIPSDIVYQDELVTAFRDISPQAPTHILIIPNILIPTVNDVKTEHEVALGAISILGIQKIQEKWVDYYHCQYTRCQQEFKVSEGEGHCLWWHWQRWS